MIWLLVVLTVCTVVSGVGMGFLRERAAAQLLLIAGAGLLFLTVASYT